MYNIHIKYAFNKYFLSMHWIKLIIRVNTNKGGSYSEHLR